MVLLTPFHATKEPSQQPGYQIKLPMPNYFYATGLDSPSHRLLTNWYISP